MGMERQTSINSPLAKSGTHHSISALSREGRQTRTIVSTILQYSERLQEKITSMINRERNQSDVWGDHRAWIVCGGKEKRELEYAFESLSARLNSIGHRS